MSQFVLPKVEDNPILAALKRAAASVATANAPTAADKAPLSTNPLVAMKNALQQPVAQLQQDFSTAFSPTTAAERTGKPNQLELNPALAPRVEAQDRLGGDLMELVGHPIGEGVSSVLTNLGLKPEVGRRVAETVGVTAPMFLGAGGAAEEAAVPGLTLDQQTAKVMAKGKKPAPATAKGPITAEGVHAHASDLVKDWKAGIQVVTHPTVEHLPPEMQQQLRADNMHDTASAFVASDGKTIHLIADRLDGLEHVTSTVYHEGLGHIGLASKYGEAIDSALARIHASNPGVAAEAEAFMQKNPTAYANDPNRVIRAVEEVLAARSEKGILDVSLKSQITAIIKEFARSMGMNLEMSDKELAAILRSGQNKVTSGSGPKVGPSGNRYAMIGPKGMERIAKIPEDQLHPDLKGINPQVQAEAEAMEARGERPEKIWEVTGYARHPTEGVWIAEIPDDKARFNKPFEHMRGLTLHERLAGVDPSTVGASIGSHVEHPALFQVFPELENYGFERGMRGRSGGSFNPISKITKVYPEGDPMSVLLHELSGHAVQDLEGWQGGSNDAIIVDQMSVPQKESFARDLRVMLDEHGYNQEEQFEFLSNPEVVDELREIYNAGGGKQENYKITSKLRRDFGKKHEDASDDDKFAQRVASNLRLHGHIYTGEDQFQKELARLRKNTGQEEYQTKRSDLDSAIGNLSSPNKLDADSATFRIKSLAKELAYQDANLLRREYMKSEGEIGARDVQARAKMTPTDRMLTMPFTSQGIPVEQWIRGKGGSGASASEGAPKASPAKAPEKTLDQKVAGVAKGMKEGDISKSNNPSPVWDRRHVSEVAERVAAELRNRGVDLHITKPYKTAHGVSVYITPKDPSPYYASNMPVPEIRISDHSGGWGANRGQNKSLGFNLDSPKTEEELQAIINQTISSAKPFYDLKGVKADYSSAVKLAEERQQKKALQVYLDNIGNGSLNSKKRALSSARVYDRNFNPPDAKTATDLASKSGTETPKAPEKTLNQKVAALMGKAKDKAATLQQTLMTTVPGYKAVAPYLTPAEKANLRKASAEKLVQLFQGLPTSEEMASVAFSGRAKRGWYKNSAKALVDIFGAHDADRFAALLAALSPQTSVESNTVNALKVWNGWVKAGRPTDQEAILKIMGENVQGGGTEKSVLDAWRNNTYNALGTDNPRAFVLSGPKVNSFAQNLRGFVHEVTNDAWMANYGGVKQELFAKSGAIEGGKGLGYRAMSARARKAADIVSKRTGETWTPAEIQETVWSWAKTLYEARRGKGFDANTRSILEAGGLTHEAIGSTPDFEKLFVDGVYKKILEEGGYSGQVESLERNIAARGGVDGQPRLRGSATAPEGAGIAPDAFGGHLNKAADRLERLYKTRLDQKRKTIIAKAKSAGLSKEQIDKRVAKLMAKDKGVDEERPPKKS